MVKKGKHMYGMQKAFREKMFLLALKGVALCFRRAARSGSSHLDGGSAAVVVFGVIDAFYCVASD